ncbi:hypothetical protein KC19_VG115500 [Ceratodon purpureus]|uniref:NodB homology domain-containing protein n=1 Tax=Ceratodon purpureus TaxID=3225 RepID=A0A8T0HPF7_CERPU|nr:hypothetical protein KC19_VG115500 [Ceratodon purpureus]
MTPVSTYEVTSTPPIGTSIIAADGSHLRWRMVSQRNSEPKTSRIRSSKGLGFQPGSEPRAAKLITSFLPWRPGLGFKEGSKPRRIHGSSRESRHGEGAGWQSSGLGGTVMFVNSSFMANVQGNMVLTAVAVALGSLILAMVVFLGLSILCHPLWIVRWTQKLQPHILYLKPTQDKLVALTLDDGPHRHITPHLLDILKENDCKATWFLIGKHMDMCPEVVERIHAEGHEVANHMMDDVASWYLAKEEFEEHLVQCDLRLKNYFRLNSSGQPIKWFRPGHGFYNPQILRTCDYHGYRVALGSLYPMDHMFEKQAKLVVKNLLWRIHPGAVIILHDRVPQWEQTPQVLTLLLPELRSRGYKIVTLSELDESLSNKEELSSREEELPLLSQRKKTFEAGEYR